MPLLHLYLKQDTDNTVLLNQSQGQAWLPLRLRGEVLVICSASSTPGNGKAEDEGWLVPDASMVTPPVWCSAASGSAGGKGTCIEGRGLARGL